MRIKKILRIAGLVLLIALACCGVGGIPVLGRNREDDSPNDVKIEMVEAREDVIKENEGEKD